MDELITEFIAETRDMLEALSGEVVAWEAAPHDRERLDQIFRFVHTVKGNSGFFDLPRIEALSHAAEDVLADVRSGRRLAGAALVSAVLAVIDRIGLLVEALETGADVTGDDEPLIAALHGKAGPDAAQAAAPDAHRTVRSIRLSVELLDSIMTGVSDAVLARNELARRMREFDCDVAVESAFERVSASIAEIRDAIMRTRMQRIDILFAPLTRIVRDLSAELGKQVAIHVDGGDVELDREMIEMIRDPLVHIVRNAVDHGIEPPAEREQAGKRAAGSLRVSARQAGNQILIEVQDDGRGVDGDALARNAVAAGLVARDAAEAMSPQQRMALIFEPGLSTAEQVTAVSGRGVGMDVVRSNIERIGGVVEVDSKKGQGLRLVVRVPLTLTIIPALTVSADGQCYAIPRSAIQEIVRADSAIVRVESAGGAEFAGIRGRRLPLVALSGLLGTNSRAPAGRTLVILKPAGGGLYALAVDRVHDHEELVVKPAAPQIMSAGIYAGTTLSEDGQPILLLDPAGIASLAGFAFDADEQGLVGSADPAIALPREPADIVLFRALDGTRRGIRLSVVERIEDVEPSAIACTGGRLRVAIGERIVSLAGCGDRVPEARLRILRLGDGRSQVAYGFAEVIDIVSTLAEVQPSNADGEIGGFMLIDGEQVELLDPFWLFATFAPESAREGQRLSCALPGGDPWMENILRPMIESLGYDIVRPGDPCDVLILGEEDEPAATASEIIRIRSRPERSGKSDGSIYRYDRAALVSALSRRAPPKEKANG